MKLRHKGYLNLGGRIILKGELKKFHITGWITATQDWVQGLVLVY